MLLTQLFAPPGIRCITIVGELTEQKLRDSCVYSGKKRKKKKKDPICACGLLEDKKPLCYSRDREVVCGANGGGGGGGRGGG